MTLVSQDTEGLVAVFSRATWEWGVNYRLSGLSQFVPTPLTRSRQRGSDLCESVIERSPHPMWAQMAVSSPSMTQLASTGL